MSESDSQFRIRLPSPLKAKVEKSAADNGRSLNSEIVIRLAREPTDNGKLMDFLREEAAELEAQIPGIKWELDQAHKRLGEMITTLTETNNPVTDDKIALLQSQTRFYRARLEEAESRLRRIRKVIGE